jgi:hypothetical protein
MTQHYTLILCILALQRTSDHRTRPEDISCHLPLYIRGCQNLQIRNHNYRHYAHDVVVIVNTLVS